MPVCVPFFKIKNHRIFFLLLYSGLHWAFVALAGHALVVGSGSCSLQQCEGLLRRLLLPRSTDCRRAVCSGHSTQLQWRLCAGSGAWAQELPGRQSLPRPGIETMPPALAAGFLSHASPGKSRVCVCVCVCGCVCVCTSYRKNFRIEIAQFIRY